MTATASGVSFPLPPWPSPLPSGPWVADTRWGQLVLDPSDVVGRTLLGVEGDRDVRAGVSPACADGHFWDGDLLLPLYKECARPGATVVVVGGAFGQDVGACYLLGAHVVVVEADPTIAAWLHQSVALNPGWKARVQVVGPYAAYDRPCWMTTADVAGASRSSLGVVPTERPRPSLGTVIAGGPLDAHVETHQMTAGGPVTLVQVDAQGCDLRVLRGLRKTLERWRPTIVFEYEAELAAVHGDTWQAHEDFAREIGYTLTESPTHRNNFVGRPTV